MKEYCPCKVYQRDRDYKELKFFDVQDGFGLILLKRAGLKTAIITARSTKAVEVRAKDLKIDKVSSVQWQKGMLVVRSSTKISSSGPAKKIIDAVKRSNAVTIEAWVKPQANRQTGPARIVSLSADANQRMP